MMITEIRQTLLTSRSGKAQAGNKGDEDAAKQNTAELVNELQGSTK
jgi:hypothetical protein